MGLNIKTIFDITEEDINNWGKLPEVEEFVETPQPKENKLLKLLKNLFR